MKKVLIIDNYDSFTYNLVHYLEELNCKVTILQNDEFELDQIGTFQNILLAPGPGIPKEAGLLLAVINKYATTKNILGICLGQQAIAEVFGGNLKNLDHVYHGISTKISILVDDELLFENLGKEMEVGRYHSWAVDSSSIPETLEVTSIDNHGEIMSLRHKNYNIRGVQFHPESILTPKGIALLANWVSTF